MEYKRQMDDATKQKISQTLRGRGKSSTTKEKISDALKAYWQSVPNKPTDD